MIWFSSPIELFAFAWVILICAVMIALLVVLHQEALAVSIVLAVHLYADWYLGSRILALPMIVAFLAMSFWLRSSASAPPALWLWVALLALAIFPAIHGTLVLYDALYYYPNVFIAAFLTFWLGTVIARDHVSVYRVFRMLSLLAVAIAIHTLVTAATGTIWFASPSASNAYGDAFFYELGNTGLYRIGSYFVDMNWNGTFLAVMLFIVLGLFATSGFLLVRALLLIEIGLLSFALLFTFSAGAWISCGIGIILFLLLVGRRRFTVIAAMAIAVLVMVVALQPQVESLLEHASDPVALSLRQGAWQTALRVILAFPLAGVGLGETGYVARVEPFRVPDQVVPLSHPHNSYLELGAMAGLPVLVVFTVILVTGLWRAAANWATVEPGSRPLFAGGLTAVVVLSINSITINAWTLPPLAAFGWLILGAISSPLVREAQGKRRPGSERPLDPKFNAGD
jgi:O-antigen ligase